MDEYLWPKTHILQVVGACNYMSHRLTLKPSQALSMHSPESDNCSIKP